MFTISFALGMGLLVLSVPLGISSILKARGRLAAIAGVWFLVACVNFATWIAEIELAEIELEAALWEQGYPVLGMDGLEEATILLGSCELDVTIEDNGDELILRLKEDQKQPILTSKLEDKLLQRGCSEWPEKPLEPDNTFLI